MKKYVLLVLAVIICAVSAFYAGFGREVVAEKIICSSFKTQGEAQEAYRRDAVGLAKLDRDHDGKVCESLPKNE